MLGSRLHHVRVEKTSHSRPSEASRDTELDAKQRDRMEIFIPAPDGSSKDDAFEWHLVTRNFFAFSCGKAMVGRSLGASLIDLYDRLNVWRPENPRNAEELVEYADNTGYLHFTHCPDYSLAMLHLAERLQNSDLWINAFAHCVGMHDMLSISSEVQVCFWPLPNSKTLC